MSRKHLRREPQHIGKYDDCWFYEENAGICVVVELSDGTQQRYTKAVTIPWARIRSSLGRKDKP